MKRFTEIFDDDGKIIGLRTPLSGWRLLDAPELNKSSAFTSEERRAFDLVGKLPFHVTKIDEQINRNYAQFKKFEEPINQYMYLNALKQRNLVLFYKVVSQHLEEMLPIIYTPTIGQAVEEYSNRYNRPTGLYFSYEDREHFSEILNDFDESEIDLVIVTDGEGVLGIGDWGVGGMDILIGKLAVYTLCGGINPLRCLPIQLDVGTNNEKLLNDPMYIGWRHKRVKGKEYDDFIGHAVECIRKKFPNVYLHWEDFGRDNARRNLNRFRNEMCTFNDDMQGTGATALACVLSALVAIDQKLEDQRIVFLGAGTAGCGIADQIRNAMVQLGLSEEEANKRFWMVDRNGLLTNDMTDLIDFQKPYARDRSELSNWIKSGDTYDLLTVVNNIKPTVLIGCSTVKGAFTEEIVKSMAAHTEHPLIFPLSNPTANCEADPKDLIEWTDGNVFTAAGSPFKPAVYKGETIRISQCNNAFVFPGIGLGIIAAKANRCTDGMIAAACHALSEFSPARKDKHAPLLPNFDHIQEVAKGIALAVAEQARKENVSDAPIDLDLKKQIDILFWEPQYLPLYKE